MGWTGGKLSGLTSRAAERIKKHPLTWALAWNSMPRLDLFLPHDQSYHGFKHLFRRPSGLFVDVGANNGMTQRGIRRLHPLCRILSIEANPSRIPELRRLSQRDPLADFLHVGLSDSAGELTLHTPIYRGIPIHTHTSSSREYLQVSLARDFSPGVVSRLTYRTDIVRVVTGDSLALEPDIIKIDVEGHDYQVLQGLDRTVERHRPSIMVEFTPHEPDELDEWALRFDYVPAVFDRGRDTFTPFHRPTLTEAWHASGLQVNLFLVPAERCSGRGGRGPVAVA